MLTALAVVIMSMGSLIPVNTYVCPVLCMLITGPVLAFCGRRVGWCYYLAVSLLSLLLAPDREAAMVYVSLGYYPMLKPRFDRLKPLGLCLTGKLLYFTLAGCGAYALMMTVMGMTELLTEFRGSGMVFTVLLVAVWDVLFLLVDRILGMKPRRKK